jgi:hypothetical protein
MDDRTPPIINCHFYQLLSNITIIINQEGSSIIKTVTLIKIIDYVSRKQSIAVNYILCQLLYAINIETIKIEIEVIGIWVGVEIKGRDGDQNHG